MTRIGAYTLVEARSQGAMGIVYAAREDATGRRVAVKVLRTRAKGFAHTLVAERDALQALSHPNIVRYVAHGETDGAMPFLVTEWLDGEDLEQRLLGGPLALEEAARIAVAVARALGAAHALGIVHRDVKPANIHLGDGGSVKLLDFGVAQIDGRETRGAGTALYMAPEQARAATGVDARADVYALGCVLFECLAGRTPFAGERTSVVLARTIFEPAPTLSAIGVAVPPRVDRLVARMLSKHPDERPATGTAAAEAIEASLRSGAEEDDAPKKREEQRIGCIALLGFASNATDTATLVDHDAHRHVARLSALADDGRVDLHRLLDGTFLARSRDIEPVDQALCLARFAVDAVTELPRAHAAVATGAFAAAFERAEDRLRLAQAGAARACDDTVRLLSGRFAVDGDVLRATTTIVPVREPPVGRGALVDEILAARSALVLGEAGIGKTCILHECARRSGALVYRAEPHLAGTAFGVFLERWRDRGGRILAERDVIARIVEDAATRPVMIDDAQWLDPASARVVEVVAKSGAPIYAFGREDARVLAPSFARCVEVGPLDREASIALALSSKPDRAAAEAIADRALGHPFVVRELARADESVPDTVLGVVQARLARLGEGARRLARIASVIGVRFDVEVLRRVAGSIDDLAELRRARIVEGDAFTSSLYRDAAYELESPDARAETHARLADFFADDPALAAFHAERGGLLSRAAHAYREASARARAVDALPLALEHARRGIACGPDAELLGALRLEEASALVASGSFAEACARAEEALELLPFGGADWITAIHVLSKASGRRADARTIATLPARLALAPRGDHITLGCRLRALCSMASWLWTLGYGADAEPLEREIAELAAELSLSETDRALVHHLRAVRAEHRGEWALMQEEHSAAGELHARRGDRGLALVSRLNVGGALGEIGKLDLAIATLGLAVQEARTGGLGYVLGYARYLRGRYLRRAGRFAEAEEELTQALEEAGGDRRLRAQAHTELAHLAIARDPDEAHERLEVALELAREAPSALAHVLAARADLERREGELEAALETSAAALAQIAHDPGDDPSYVQRVRLDVLAATKDPDPAAFRAAYDDLLARTECASASPDDRAIFLAFDDNARILALTSSVDASRRTPRGA